MNLNEKFMKSQSRWEEVNHLLKDGYTKEIYRNEESSIDFLKTHGINKNNIQVKEDFIFYLTPFHSEMDIAFKTCRSSASDLGFKLTRGDEMMETSDIFQNILKNILESKFIIANITGRNSNVYYELGIAHALNKYVILICDVEFEPPFDLQSKRIAFYQQPKDLERIIPEVIAKASFEINGKKITSTRY